jgi:hypothetical protein
MRSLSRGVILSWPYPFSHHAEQRSIVAQVCVLMALRDRLETSLAPTAARLLDALLAAALDPAKPLEMEAAG